jgi:tRNA threonylcarbamoyladenosine biosynthesis protein TsaE
VTLRPAPVVTARTSSAAETRDLAARVAALCEAGDIVVLAGELGSGKTVWVQGFARGLGVEDAVTSPTFTLVRPHQGRQLRLLHADVYRLDRLDEVIDLGLVEQLDDRSVACIEWGDLAEPALPKDFLEIRLEHDDRDGDDERTLTMRAVGPRWAARLDSIRAALAPWLPGLSG